MWFQEGEGKKMVAAGSSYTIAESAGMKLARDSIIEGREMEGRGREGGQICFSMS